MNRHHPHSNVHGSAVSSVRALANRLFNACPRTALATASAVALLLTGCVTPPPTDVAAIPPAPSPQTLHPGDVVKISFPRTPTLDTTQQIRRDGKINLYLVGEVQASGLAPAELERQLAEKYSKQVVSSEVLVTVVSSAFTVYVSGAVRNPGRIAPDRELTLMEALLEAGGFDPQRANLKAVSIMRRNGSETKNFVVDLQAALDGKQAPTFFLEPNDIVFVPERKSIF